MRKMNFRSLEYYLPVEIQSLPKHEIIELLETHLPTASMALNALSCRQMRLRRLIFFVTPNS